ncbi:MAG TPA: FAD-dependent oxidoreductase, partial [Micromonosporaceae bacterium]
VVGGDAAGMSAASQARRRQDAQALEIIAFERGPDTSFSACGIPYWIGGDVSDVDNLISRTPEVFEQKYDIEVRLHSEAVRIDPDRRTVTIRSGETIGFDKLMIGTGATPIRPPLPGIDLPGVYGVQTLDDGAAVQRALRPELRHAVVVGGGYIGLEMAEALVRRNLRVTIVEAADQLMSTMDPDMAGQIADAVRGMGIRIRLGEKVQAIEGASRARSVVTTNGTIPADIVILGLGVRPNSELAERAGIAVGPTGGIVTDSGMRCGDGIWAAGDCVESFHRVSRRPVHVALGTHANKQGRVAGINIGGGYATFPGVVGTAITKVCNLEIARTGLSSREVESAGLQAVTASVESTTRAGYFPGTTSMTTKIIAEKGSGRLLGAQIVGREQAAKRIDVLAAALWNSMTVDDITGLDLAYAPPFAPVWDPVLIAARKAVDAVARSART